MRIHVQGRARPGAAIGRPAEHEIADICTEESFERGKRLHARGRVSSARISGGAVTAYVADTERYRVMTPLPPGSAKHSCTCGCSGKRACEHVAAALLYISERFEGVPKSGAGRGTGVKSVLRSASHESLREFLEIAMKGNKDLRSQFLAYFGADTNRNYRGEIDREYARAYRRDDYYVKADLSPFLKTAKTMEREGGYAEALRIYTAVAEAVEDNMGRTYEYGERYYRYFVRAVEGMANCISGQELEHSRKREYISYLFERAMKVNMDYLDDSYEGALRKICSDRQDLLYWKSLLEPSLPVKIRNGYDSRGAMLVNMQTHILEELGDPSREEVYLRNYRTDVDVCIRYVEYLKGLDPGKAIQVAEEGMRLFPGRNAMDAAVQLYGEDDPRRAALLEGLFCATHEWSYYDMLLKSSGDRQGAVESVLTSLRRRGDLGVLVGALLREGDYDRAVSEAVSAGSLELLEMYHDQLCERYPGKYYAAYRGMLEGADPGRDSQDYRKFGVHLRRMRSVPGHEREFREFVGSIKEEFRRRPSLMAELDSL